MAATALAALISTPVRCSRQQVGTALECLAAISDTLARLQLLATHALSLSLMTPGAFSVNCSCVL